MAIKNNEDNMLAVEVPEIITETVNIKIIGDTPLIVHKWSEKAKKEILYKQMKKASAGRDAKDPFMDYCESMYWLDGMPEHPTQEDIDNARFGFPAIAFKASAIDAAYQQGIIQKKTTARGAFHVLGEFVEIIGKPNQREDMVKIATTTDIRYRAEFRNWSAVLTVRYFPKAISLEQIVGMLNFGGFANGVGEWRPSKDGTYGTFHVERNTQ